MVLFSLRVFTFLLWTGAFISAPFFIPLSVVMQIGGQRNSSSWWMNAQCRSIVLRVDLVFQMTKSIHIMNINNTVNYKVDVSHSVYYCSTWNMSVAHEWFQLDFTKECKWNGPILAEIRLDVLYYRFFKKMGLWKSTISLMNRIDKNTHWKVFISIGNVLIS